MKQEVCGAVRNSCLKGRLEAGRGRCQGFVEVASQRYFATKKGSWEQ